ncbi:MAG: NAD(+)/NADH kinase [Spirochaetales bacterium]|nr:NAD(+)/NADH kinase [Spirochaetales bacterium]
MGRKTVRKVLIVVNLLKEASKELVREISVYMNSLGITVEVLGLRGREEIPEIPEAADTDLVLSLGGDGTVLFTARSIKIPDMPVLAVNIGDLGFITEVTRDEWRSAFDGYLAGTMEMSPRILIKVRVERSGGIVAEYEGLNDAVVCADGISKVVRLSVTIGQTRLGKYRADGIIVSTPTGSTAYSAAAGGPVLAPEMEALVLTPICPFTLSNRTIVVKGDECIAVTVEQEQRAKLILTVDGQVVFPLEPGDVIHISQSDRKFRIVCSNKRNFYEVLRTKLNWSGGPDA